MTLVDWLIVIIVVVVIIIIYCNILPLFIVMIYIYIPGILPGT